MAKVTGPLLSLRGAGSIAKSQVYATWKGVPYVRQHVVPTNPRSDNQTKTRSVFGNLMLLWKNLDTIAQGPFIAFATGKPLTPRNAYARANVSVLRTATDMTDYVGSEGSGGGVAPTLIAIAGGAASGGLAVTVTAPAAPTGWTLSKVQAFAVQNTDPHMALPMPVASGENTAPVAGETNVVQLTGLKPGTEHAVTAWLVWTKAAGAIAYGASITGTGTTTA